MKKERVKIDPISILTACLFMLMVSILSEGLLAAQDYGSSEKNASQKNQEKELFSIAGSGEQFELTVTYPQFEAGETISLTMYLAELVTNRPVIDAEIVLILSGNDVEKELKPQYAGSPGVYKVDVSIDSAEGGYSFLVEVTAGDDMDLFDIDGFGVPNPPPAITAKESLSPARGFWEEYMVFLALGGMVITWYVGYSLGFRRRKTLSQ